MDLVIKYWKVYLVNGFKKIEPRMHIIDNTYQKKPFHTTAYREYFEKEAFKRHKSVQLD